MSYYMINATKDHAILSSDSSDSSTIHEGTFLFRSDSPSIRIKQSDEFTSVIDGGNSASTGDRALLYNKAFVNKVLEPIRIPNKELLPQESYRVEYMRKYRNKEIRYYQHAVHYTQGKSFNEFRFLDDYSYSLLKIYKRYVKPIRHFSKSITELPENDFNTLNVERIFVARTIFGRLINALPYPNRLQFLLFCVEEFGEVDLRQIEFSRATPLLKKFVGQGVISMGKYLQASIELIVKHQEIFGDHRIISFQDEKDRITESRQEPTSTLTSTIDNVHTQAQLFGDLFNENDNFEQLFDTSDIQQKRGDIEEFEKIFDKRSWPVDLNTDQSWAS